MIFAGARAMWACDETGPSPVGVHSDDAEATPQDSGSDGAEQDAADDGSADGGETDAAVDADASIQDARAADADAGSVADAG